MKTVATILVIFLARSTHLRAEPIPTPLSSPINPNSCIFGVKSVSMIRFDSGTPQGKTIGLQESCDDLDPSKPIVFVVHGFISSANMSSTQEMAPRLVQKGRTVFALDWSQGACKEGMPLVKYLEYPSAVKNTREVGHLMASYIVSLIKKCGVPMEKITLIGHSLGAHVSGFAAKTIQMGLGTLPLILAADPADPLFGSKKCHERICESDAKRLVVLHTSTLGISRPIGHLDLQFNGGMTQPECDMNIACAHTKSMDYITNMIDDCGFLGVPPMKPKSMLSKMLPSKKPPYPSNDTTDCIIVNSNILDADNSMEGEYYVFVKKDSLCTSETFSCQQQ
jgi:hypothetical protein